MWRYWRWHFRGRLDISMVSERPKNGQGEHQSIKQKKPFRECRLALDLVKIVRIWTNINHNTDSNTDFSYENQCDSIFQFLCYWQKTWRWWHPYVSGLSRYFKNSIVPLNLWTTRYLLFGAYTIEEYCCTCTDIPVLTRSVPRRQFCRPSPPRPWGPRWGWPPEGWPYCHPHPHPASRKILI